MTNSQEPTKCIIKIEQCPTLSNNSTLTYHIGCDEGDDKQSIFFRIVSNSGNGFFNDDWVALLDIQQAFDKWPVDNPITSFALHELFIGRSANTSAFLLAALKEEKIVATLKGQRRNHEYIEPVEFFEAMNKLIADGVNLNAKVGTNKKESSTAKSRKKSA